MAIDSIFNGNPTTRGVSASGKATLGIDISTGKLYFRDDAVGGWQETVGSSGSSPYKSASVTLSAAQIIALGSTPVQIVAGVAGVYLSIQQAIIEYIFGGTPFTTASGAILIGNGTTGLDANDLQQTASGFLNQTESLVQDSGGQIIGNTPTPSATLNGEGIYCCGVNGWNVTGGNGSLKVTVIYSEITL